MRSSSQISSWRRKSGAGVKKKRRSVCAGTRNGFTLIEIVMVIAIIGILASAGSYLMIYLVQNSVFIPNQLNTDMAAAEALKIMIEGDATAKGLRFSRAMSSVADDRVSFTNQDGSAVVYRLDTAAGRLYRSVNAGPEAAIPYYAPSAANISAPANRLFTYYDASGAETASPLSVRRVKISLVVKTGSGAYADWEGQSAMSSSVFVPRFQ